VLDRIEPSVKALIVHVEKNSDYREPGVADQGPGAKSVPKTPVAKASTSKAGEK
jgi:hypothetical protein